MNEKEIFRDIDWAMRVNRFTQEISGDNVNLNIKTLQGLLDLYNKAKQELQQEKEKNKKLEEELNKFRKGEIFSANQTKFMEKQNKVLQNVIDLMATDNALLCTDYEFGCFYEKNAECMKGPVRNCKECITEYYFKKARGEEDEKGE